MPQDTPGWLLRCKQCGKSVPCTMSDLLTFSQRGWPKCCGEVMTLYAQVQPDERPKPKDKSA